MCISNYIQKIISDNATCAVISVIICLLIFIIINNYIERRRIKLLDIQFKTIDGISCCGIEGFAQINGGHGFYKMHEDLEDPEGAARVMDKLNITAQALIAHLNDKYKSDNIVDYYIKPKFAERVKFGIKSLNANYDPTKLEENVPERSGGDTSYVVDKGTVFAMCLRDPKNNNKLDDKLNSLTFVLIHEMSHLFTKTYGHGTLFWNNFNFLLQEASGIGLYKPTNYKNTGSPYCGIVITYSPLFDANLDNYFKQQNI